MRFMKMDCIFLFKFGELGLYILLLLKATEDISKCGCNIEVLLLEPDLFVPLEVVIRVENGSDVFSLLALLN